MSGQTDTARGEGGWSVFLSAHRCPEVDVLPHQNAEPQIPPLCSPVPAEKTSEFTCTGESEADYLDICSTHHSKAQGEEEDEGSISDWSEEDLSLHFSPSVIVQSDDESDPESGFECINITMETQMKGQDGEGLKMVPKRQIQLKKKKDGKDSSEQMILKDGPAEGRGVNTNEPTCSTTHPWPDLLLRQHSMPTSFHATSRTSSDANSYKVYKGLITGAAQGFLVGGNSRRLQKSFSLDETKTKMASCLIKNVLSKKMQVEQNNLRKNPEVTPFLLPPVKQQGGQTGGIASRAPVHVVRDMRSLVKHTYSHSFTTTSVSHDNNTTRRFKATGQEDSPPPAYQQEVGVKGHVSKVAASFSQSQDKKQSKPFRQPITQQRRGSEPIISTGLALLDPPTMKPNQSEKAMTPSPCQGTQAPLFAEKQSSILGVIAPSAPCSSQQLPQPTFPAAMHPHLGKVGYVHTPLSYIQTQQPTPDPSNHLPRRFEEIQNQSTGNFSKKMDQARTTQNEEDHGSTATPPSQEQPELQQQHHHLQQHQEQKHHLNPQPFLCSVPSFLPAQVGGDFHVDMSGSVAAPGAYFRVPAPCQLMLDPKSGRFFYTDTSFQAQRKMLLDPETGQFFQVFLPAASSVFNTAMFPVCCVNPASTVLSPTPTVVQVGNANPTLVSVMPFKPVVGVSTIYGPSYLPVTVMTSHPQHSDDITSLVVSDH